VSFLAIPLGVVLLLRPALDAVHLQQVAPFYLSAWLLVAVWFGAGAGAIADAVHRRARRALGERGRRAGGALRAAGAALCALALLAPAHLLSRNFAGNDLRDFFDARVYGENLLRALPRGATLVTEGDNEAFILAYLTQGLGRRADARIVQRKGFLFAAPATLRAASRRAVEREARAWMRAVTAGECVYAATYIPPERMGGRALARDGLLFRSAGEAGGETPAPSGRARAALRAADMSVLGRDPRRFDFLSRKFAIGYLEARWDLRARDGGDAAGAGALLAAIGAWGHDFAEAQFFVARERERGGDLAAAYDAYRAAARLDPAADAARAGIARVLAANGR
jgi:hypothetical protein